MEMSVSPSAGIRRDEGLEGVEVVYERGDGSGKYNAMKKIKCSKVIAKNDEWRTADQNANVGFIIYVKCC